MKITQSLKVPGVPPRPIIAHYIGTSNAPVVPSPGILQSILLENIHTHHQTPAEFL